jgi:hypothetical protein
MTTVLDVIRRAASDRAFSPQFAKDPVRAARSIGLQVGDRDDAGYLEARLNALARPLDRERTRQQLAQAAEDMAADLGLAPNAAAVEAARAVSFVRDYRFHQRLLNTGEPHELERLIESFACEGSPTQDDCGTLLLTLHYGPFPLLWLWLKHAQVLGRLRALSLFYDARFYTPDVSSAQYERLASAGTVPPTRRDIDIGEVGVRRAVREAVTRLRSGESVLMLPDAFAVPAGESTRVCRVGELEVAYPRGAAWLAKTAHCAVQGAVVRPEGDSHSILFDRARPGPADHRDVAEVVQDLFDASVGRDPAAWLAWITHS